MTNACLQAGADWFSNGLHPPFRFQLAKLRLPNPGQAESDATDRSQAGFDNQLGAYTELRDAFLGAKTFGASAPLKELLVKFPFTDDNVCVAAKHQLAHKE